MLPRALVVRSGSRSILEGGAPPRAVEIVERVSHAIEPVDAPSTAHAADLVIFTSRVAVAQGLAGRNREALRAAIAAARRVAVGSGTASALEDSGLAPQIVAEGSAEAVLASLPARLEGVRVLLPCGEDASLELPERLRARGAQVTRAVVYRKVAHPPDEALAGEILEGSFAAFCATSPAAAAWLFEGLGERALEVLRATPAAALGPSTRAFFADRGVSRVAVAPDARFSSVLRLLEALATTPAGQ
jgi:uroporphyrinogen-III synthase